MAPGTPTVLQRHIQRTELILFGYCGDSHRSNIVYEMSITQRLLGRIDLIAFISQNTSSLETQL